MSTHRDDNQEASELERRIVEFLPILDSILRRLRISRSNRPGPRQQMEDDLQNILLLLIEDDYRRLRTYDQRYPPNGWLTTITIHYLVDCLRRQPTMEECSKVLSGALRDEAKQEEEMIYQERLGQFHKALGQLSDQDRRLGALLCSDLETEEIALALKTEPCQVRKLKYKLIKKVRNRLAEGGASAGKNNFRTVGDIFLRSP